VSDFLFERTSPRETSLTRDAIEGCTDLEQLGAWFEEELQRAVEMKAFLEAFRDADINDEIWFRRTAGALAYSKIGARWIERRILLLGGEPRYWPTDPRARQLRILNEKVEKLNNRVRELEGRPEE
jgi:hypothetical protein